MSKDYYKSLGVDKKASKAEIKKAFRNAAKTHHPDKGGDPEKFKEINQAYEVLSDDKKRQQYDTFGSAGPSGFGGAQGFSGFSGGFGGANGQAYHMNFEDLGDIFGSFFGGASGFGGQQWANRPRRGSDLEVEAELSFAESINGAKRKFRSSFGDRSTIEIDVPPGLGHGDTLRMRGKGDEGKNGGPAGDLYIHIRVKPSKEFVRQGIDIVSELEVPVFEALLGKVETVKTFWGKEDIVIPELTRDGTVIKIPGKGVKKGARQGDHLVRIKYVFPKKLSKKLRKKLEEAQKV